MSVVEARELLDSVDSSKSCIGNSDQKFAVLLASRKGIFKDPTGL